ncbi:P2Y purinoceptor 13-like [Trichomycterus rosablanca]|uniref:P2Y purinoceptor 13-like n=1 Tax=Trichomycterus rosablanca TaxID=2290929 RepID=UPI002F357D04
MEAPNATFASHSWECGSVEKSWHTVVPILYFLLFPPAFLINVMVAWICTHLRTKSTFMVYLKHLVVADLLMTLTFPVRAASMLPKASPGLQAFACRFSSVFFYLAMNMSTILMGLISLDRFLKIVMPGRRFLCQSLLFSKVLTAVVWMSLIGSNTLPIIITTDQDPTNKSNEFCMAMKSDVGRSWHKGVIMFSKVIFWIVCGTVMLCYMCIAKKVLKSYRKSRSSNSQGKRKAKVRVFLILFVFVICYIPFHLVRIPYTNLQVISTHTCSKATLKIVKDLTLWLSATNVCLDPLIYFFLCKAFRKMFLRSYSFKKLLQSFDTHEDASQSAETSF